MVCKAIRSGDQMQCGQCGLSWDVNDDDRPTCTPSQKMSLSTRMRRDRALKKVDWVRRTHGFKRG